MGFNQHPFIGDNHVVIINVEQVHRDMEVYPPELGLNLGVVANLLQGGTLLSGDYYIVKNKKQVMEGLIARSNSN